MEDSLERKEKQEGESDKFPDKTGKEKASAEEMRNKAMERLGETKKRTRDDQPWKKRKHTPNETMNYLREATEMECKLKKEELEFRKKQEERALATKPGISTTARNVHAISRPVKKSMQQQQFQMMCQMSMQQRQHQNQALLELLKKGHRIY